MKKMIPAVSGVDLAMVFRSDRRSEFEDRCSSLGYDWFPNGGLSRG
jgi:hypothetical protein